ncbi:hypothetical protein FJT64_024500 [Amphibalanus amphitrite]|uniref:Uncharacterized protein n=1 Tax=Amphibalanus amphitrite TaxID=1232801 RepID=A0A6A4WI54_AMPAM|nr:hypothetical protein FJT64_024500 [Amphibalanus amphitrite]
MVRCAPRARLLLLAGLLSAAAAPGRAAFTDVFQLPSQTFQLVAPQWLWAGHGFVNDTAAVYWTGVTGSLFLQSQLRAGPVLTHRPRTAL